MELVLTSPKYGYTATAIEKDGEITVLKGSQAVAKEFAQNQYGPLREQLIKDGRIKRFEGQPFLEFAEGVTFPGPAPPLR